MTRSSQYRPKFADEVIKSALPPNFTLILLEFAERSSRSWHRKLYFPTVKGKLTGRGKLYSKGRNLILLDLQVKYKESCLLSFLPKISLTSIASFFSPYLNKHVLFIHSYQLVSIKVESMVNLLTISLQVRIYGSTTAIQL